MISDSTLVGVHIRGGDYRSHLRELYDLNPVNVSYIDKAVKHYRRALGVRYLKDLYTSLSEDGLI